MVTWYQEVYCAEEGTTYREGVCLSSDTKPKPSDLRNGSKIEELDTGAVYRYDRDGADWVKQWTMPQAAESAGA